MSARENDVWHHATVILDDDGELVYAISHPHTCQTDIDTIDGTDVVVYGCPTTWEYTEGGRDDTWPTEPGTYRVRGWERTHPATVDHGTELDGGLEWEPAPSPLPEIEHVDTAYLTCPYYREIEGGVCVSGCWEEPVCRTDEPTDGWRARDRHGRFIELSVAQLDAMAQQRLDDYRTLHPPLRIRK